MPTQPESRIGYLRATNTEILAAPECHNFMDVFTESSHGRLSLQLPNHEIPGTLLDFLSPTGADAPNMRTGYQNWGAAEV
jgi:uncharacterized protein YbaR (Trm112 family)